MPKVMDDPPEDDRIGRMIDTLAALVLINEKENGKRGVVGTVVCPRCEGEIRYSIARVNGHVHAKCRTEGCISFME